MATSISDVVLLNPIRVILTYGSLVLRDTSSAAHTLLLSTCINKNKHTTLKTNGQWYVKNKTPNVTCATSTKLRFHWRPAFLHACHHHNRQIRARCGTTTIRLYFFLRGILYPSLSATQPLQTPCSISLQCSCPPRSHSRPTPQAPAPSAGRTSPFWSHKSDLTVLPATL